MKLSDIIKPEDSDILKPKGKTTERLRDIVRSKGFKSMVRALSAKSNPKDENHDEGDVVGDGQRHSDTMDDNQTKDLM